MENEKLLLALMAGARAIANNKRLHGTLYCWDIWGENGGPKEISYLEAATLLAEAADRVEERPPEGESTGKWISVKERLPDAPGHYLVCTSINYWHGGCLDKNEERTYLQKSGTPEGYEGTTMSVLDCYFDCTGDWNRVFNGHVTHWMPLPDAPKGDNYCEKEGADDR